MTLRCPPDIEPDDAKWLAQVQRHICWSHEQQELRGPLIEDYLEHQGTDALPLLYASRYPNLTKEAVMEYHECMENRGSPHPGE